MDRPMRRIIFLVDMNAFFISCEMSRNPALKGNPAAVAGDPENRSGIILAANYDARAYGVKTTMLIHEAMNLCPGLLLVPPDHSFYEMKSREVMEILSRYTPVLQQNSIDEAWLDMSGTESLFGEPLQAAGKIMGSIQDELDLWCSVGISENKFLAKMASEMKKPLGITELWKKDVRQKLWPLKVRDMYGIGRQTEKRLNELGILTIGDLAAADAKLLRSFFGRYGEEMKSLANGVDTSEVTPRPKYETRSISRSTTLRRDTRDLEYVRAVLLRLSEEVGEEARRCDFKGRTVTIVMKYNDFKTVTRQKAISPSYLTKDIYRTGTALLQENWDRRKPLRLVGIGLGNIDEDVPEQLSIFDVDERLRNESKREEKLEKAIDEIRSRFGGDKLKRAKLVEKSEKQDNAES